METVVVVGSGASSVHFAATALYMGRRVRMIDVGRSGPAAVDPGASFNDLKRTLQDPVRYFLGERYEALILPHNDAEYYGFPPNKTHVFSKPDELRYRATGFAPLVSFAAGGLAEAWTGGCYPFRDDELTEFPFGYDKLGPCYGEVARRIGVTGADDDLAAFFPLHDGLLKPLDLDEHSARLLASYDKRKRSLNEKLRCYVGRSRSAVLSSERNGRKPCSYTGRCMWGCPSDAFYTPSVTLRECLRHPNFEYIPGYYARHFRFDSSGRITELIAEPAGGGPSRHFSVEKLALGAGALCSSKIFLDSIYKDSGEIRTLRGLMDNRQVLMPFVNLGMLGRRHNPDSYQYHQLAIGLEGAGAMDYVHGLVTTLKTALIHPVAQSIPFDLATAASFLRNMHAALGLVNINFSDQRREENYLTLDPGPETGQTRLVVHYEPPRDEPRKIAATAKKFRSILWQLGCVAPPPMTHIRPMGASVHYAGSIPMSEKPAPLSCSPYCQSYDFPNLYLIDGATFPALPAKNLTFTLMANAVRVAREIFA